EACDSGGVNTANCDANCTAVSCGDGTFNASAGEQCDDGNAIDNDGCNTQCQTPSCGNSIVDQGEACDSGGVNTATCDANCTAVSCGDGTFNPAAGEACDDGNAVDNDGCNTLCQIPTCG